MARASSTDMARVYQLGASSATAVVTNPAGRATCNWTWVGAGQVEGAGRVSRTAARLRRGRHGGMRSISVVALAVVPPEDSWSATGAAPATARGTRQSALQSGLHPSGRELDGELVLPATPPRPCPHTTTCGSGYTSAGPGRPFASGQRQLGPASATCPEVDAGPCSGSDSTAGAPAIPRPSNRVGHRPSARPTPPVATIRLSARWWGDVPHQFVILTFPIAVVTTSAPASSIRRRTPPTRSPWTTSPPASPSWPSRPPRRRPVNPIRTPSHHPGRRRHHHGADVLLALRRVLLSAPCQNTSAMGVEAPGGNGAPGTLYRWPASGHHLQAGGGTDDQGDQAASSTPRGWTRPSTCTNTAGKYLASGQPAPQGGHANSATCGTRASSPGRGQARTGASASSINLRGGVRRRSR